MTNPNTSVWLSLLRSIVMAICGVLVTKGVVSAADAPALQTALETLLPSLVAAGLAWWGAHTHTDASKVADIKSMPTEAANAAVLSLPTTAKNAIKIATMSDVAIVNAAAALPDVTGIKVASDAGPGLSALAENPAQPKVLTEGVKS